MSDALKSLAGESSTDTSGAGAPPAQMLQAPLHAAPTFASAALRENTDTEKAGLPAMPDAARVDAIWQELARARAEECAPIRELMTAPERFEGFSARFGDLLLDYSKTALTARSRALLLDLAAATDVCGWREAMFSGAMVNSTEGRAALHTALRDAAPAPLMLDGSDVKAEIREVLGRLAAFSEGVRAGTIAGIDGSPFTDVVNIGIGGSDLGPAMVTEALVPYHDGPACHFVSNADGAHIADVLARLDPATTLFIVCSKTFTTVETLSNARIARNWLTQALGEAAVGAHFVAVSTALDKVEAFGISRAHTFGFWDFVGGRYSVWSAIGLAVMIAIGPARFADFLAGAEAMDRHFRTAPLEENLPVLLALIGLWHRDVCLYPTRAVIPYDQHLCAFPAYLQQLDMESNGKRLTHDGATVSRPTGPIVWGGPGTNAQHAFFQLLHQGTDAVPVEFLVGAQGHEPGLEAAHALLVANCLAQSEALMRGRTLAEAEAQLRAKGLPAEEVARLAPHRVFPGDRPSVTLAYGKLDPFTLGRLIALYEHRVFVEAVVWGINPFDQWGVELGKELATALLPAITGAAAPEGVSASAAGLIRHLRAAVRA